MHRNSRNVRLIKGLVAAVLLAPPAGAQFYKQSNLVADVAGQAPITDPALINPWGVAFSPTSPFWVSNAGTNTSTLYSVDAASGAVAKVPLVVNTPGPPSGQVFNPSSDFVVTSGGASGAASFLFAGLNGIISGWNAGVPPPPPSTQAILAATVTPAAYTGLAMGFRGSDRFLFAANNAANRVDVFSKTFGQVVVPGAFGDPGLPGGVSPFNVVNIGNLLYVTYSGPVGVVNVFDTNGTFIKRFATGGTLLNPWGIALAPANFGKFSGALLIGNFNQGDPAVGPGSISAFDAVSGSFLGLLEDNTGATLSIDGLWTLTFGNGASGGKKDVLYFTAGVQKEAHGLFGSLTTCREPEINGVSASPNTLWPPNHQMTPVAVNYTVTDDCTPAPACTLSVTSNEGQGGGSGNTSPDWIVVDAHHVQVRSERDGGGDGRVYAVAIHCVDKLGLSSDAKTKVTVAHDQGEGNGDDDNKKDKDKDNGKDKKDKDN